jgi:phage baseplate assembly protein W
MDLAYPYRFDRSGRSAAQAEDLHVRELIEQLLFTQPGERLMRPDFGCGLMQLVFALNSPELAGATEKLVQGALQRWLADRVAVDDVRVRAVDSTLEVTVQYTWLRDGRVVSQTFMSPASGA